MRGFWNMTSLFVVILASAWIPVERKEKTPRPCHFTNPSYAGVCTVQPKGDETCKSILAYLNQPNSTGKTYCNDTILRGGWKKANPPDSKKKAKSGGS